MQNTSILKLAKMLRTKPEILDNLVKKMDSVTGKNGIVESIIKENETLVKRTMQELSIPESATANQTYKGLVKRLTDMDNHLYEYLGKPDLTKMGNICGKLCEVAAKLNSSRKGFFIKKERAIEMLESFPPNNLLEHFGFSSVKQLVEEKGFAPTFASLRFAQDNEWMHKFFDEPYRNLKPEDFEERDVELIVLNTEWLEVAEKFMKKKYHNVSHLKEYGVIFITPLTMHAPGETMRMFTLLLHYLNEVPFYSKLFRKFAKGDSAQFITSLQSLLRGDVPEGPAPEGSIRIVQRYLAKDNENDFRLLEPHVNPEAEHWYKAEGDLGGLDKIDKKDGYMFGYWQGLDFVGDFFPRQDGTDRLVSFDLIDLVMSLVIKGEVKYLYHQEEALWNKIFIGYLGRDKMNELIEENIVNGFIKL